MQVSPLQVNPERVVDEIERARAEEYALLATLLARCPDSSMIGRLALLRGDPTPLGVAHGSLGTAAARATARKVQARFFGSFHGAARATLRTHACYFLTAL